jgi:Lon protease-like protein
VKPLKFTLYKPSRVKRLRNGVLHRQRFVRPRNQLVHGPYRDCRVRGEWSEDPYPFHDEVVEFDRRLFEAMAAAFAIPAAELAGSGRAV